MSDLNVLVIGSGGREHALAWALARSQQVKRVFVAPGNGGTQWPGNPSAEGWQPRAEAVNVPINAEDIPALVAFAGEQGIDLTVVGPEVALSLGIVDAFQRARLRIFGPTQSAARLESSKTFAKDFMRDVGIPTAEYGSFEDYKAACDFVNQFGKPVVVKADGLAAGKGVIVCDTPEEARTALHRIMVEREFGSSGSRVIVEERLNGPELSVLAFCDGKTVALMPFARDHKRIFDDDKGANTGGMGAYAPVPNLDPKLSDILHQEVMQRTVYAMTERGTPYVGVLYAGFILTADGPKVLEFNCRFGDPETQAILPLLNSDLAVIMLACSEGRLSEVAPQWLSGTCATVVLASEGYPGSYPKGLPISGLDYQSDQVMVFHAGTANRAGQVETDGGRVLAVSAYGDDMTAALNRAYAYIDHLHFAGMHYRRDIGRLHQQELST